MIVVLRTTLFAIGLLIIHGLVTGAGHTTSTDLHRQGVQELRISSLVSEVVLGNRRPRATVTAGNAAILRLLGSTMRIFNDGWNVVFAKKGNLNDAIRDFTLLHPSDVNAIIKDRHLPTRLTGRVDDLQVVVQERHGSVTLDIATTKKDGISTTIVPLKHRIIVYTTHVPKIPTFTVFK